jgi:hypothetical protein
MRSGFGSWKRKIASWLTAKLSSLQARLGLLQDPYDLLFGVPTRPQPLSLQLGPVNRNYRRTLASAGLNGRMDHSLQNLVRAPSSVRSKLKACHRCNRIRCLAWLYRSMRCK